MSERSVLPLLPPACSLLSTNSVDMQTITSKVLDRADQLMIGAPGRVSVERIIEIGDVRLLRTAREVLTEAELEALKHLRLQIVQRLDGSVAVPGPKVKEKKRGFLGSLLATAADNFSSDMQPKGDFKQLARQDGVVNRLPAPPELIDAAETWAVSYLVADRVDVDLDPLRKPWLEASISTA